MRLLWSGERCITMAMAAGKSAGKPPRMTDKAFKPPTEAAMAMTGDERLAGGVGCVPRWVGACFSFGGCCFVFRFNIIGRIYPFPFPKEYSSPGKLFNQRADF